MCESYEWGFGSSKPVATEPVKPEPSAFKVERNTRYRGDRGHFVKGLPSLVAIKSTVKQASTAKKVASKKVATKKTAVKKVVSKGSGTAPKRSRKS